MASLVVEKMNACPPKRFPVSPVVNSPARRRPIIERHIGLRGVLIKGIFSSETGNLGEGETEARRVLWSRARRVGLWIVRRK